MQYASGALQILILTAGIHVFLRFVRTTRGNPLIRGLFLSVLVGVVGLFGIATVLELEELEHILQRSTGLIVVGLAVIFQPELRRGIAQLGERSVTRKSNQHGADTIRQTVEAVTSLASRRVGALIAFERETSLSTIVETGSALQARVSARLLESLFHPGGALHDGAVVVRQERVVAAGCFLPLTKDDRLDASHGTRHRAAVGLSEESDAVVLVVSEETGSVSLASGGQLLPNVEPAQLESELRRHLVQGDATGSGRRRGLGVVLNVLRRDIGWLCGSALLACGAWYAAHQSILETQEFVVQISDASLEKRRTPRDGEILIHPADPNVQVRTTGVSARYRVAVNGTRAQLNELGGSLRGNFEISSPNWEGGPLDLAGVRWEEPILGLSYVWKTKPEPELVVERFISKRLQLKPTDVEINTEAVDPNLQVRIEDVAFEPGNSLEIFGPATKMHEMGSELAKQFAPVRLGPEDHGEVRSRLRLRPEAVSRGFRLPQDSQVEMVIQILPVHREVGTLRKEIVLLCLSPGRQELLDQWALPANALMARFSIQTAGLLPLSADLSSPALRERKTAITRFVEENLRVYVDVAELPPAAEGRSVPVRWTWLRDWHDAADSLGLDEGTLGDWQELDVRLESEPTLLLGPKPAPLEPDSQ